jgi:hypothetical protein
VLLLAGCVAPIGADRVTTRQAYAQVDENALRAGKPSASTVAILHRYDLDRLAAERPSEAVSRLHQKALETGERDLLFALSELSYAAGDHVRRSVKPWDPRRARDYYLASAVYSWLFLFGEGKDPAPRGFDRRFREACDFYNYSLGLGLASERSTNGIIQLQDQQRRLPVGEIALQLSPSASTPRLEEFDSIVLADQFRIRGMSVRNRNPGIGAPVVCVRPVNPEFDLRPCSPATVLLRGPASLTELSAGRSVCSLELHPGLGPSGVTIGEEQVPLELDLTTYRAYALSQSRVWKLGKLQFWHPPSESVVN